MILHHFTCMDHGLVGIHRDKMIRPMKHPAFDFDPVIWLTDYNRRTDAGTLSIHKPSGGVCDRAAVCFTVDTEAEPWSLFADRMGVDPAHRAQLEALGAPERWFVRSEGIPASQWRSVGRSGLWTPS